MWHLERKELVNEFGEFSPTARYLFTESGNDGSPLQYGALSLMITLLRGLSSTW